MCRIDSQTTGSLVRDCLQQQSRFGRAEGGRAASRVLLAIVSVALVTLSSATGNADDALATIERLVASDPKPFVLVEAAGEGGVNRAQGVVVSPQGYVLSVGHVAWVEANQSFSDRFRVSFRGTGQGLPEGMVHVHKTTFSDFEDAPFFENYYSATLLQNGGSRYIGRSDLALFRIRAEGAFPQLEFWSRQKPEVKMGETFHLCHYNFPHKGADPTFLMNPVEIVGVAQTTFGTQYLAKGYYRVGSSGGAILKDGRLIGIQSSAYTINSKDAGEIPLGLISFQPVWGELFDDLLPGPQANHAAAE
jgi:hypothetical protein